MLIEDGHHFTEFLVDQGSADSFHADRLHPSEFEEVHRKAGVALTLIMQDSYGHFYFFISAFMEDHLR